MGELKKKVIGLISKKLGVPEDQVTTEFAHNYREKNIYPNMKVCFKSNTGGVNSRAKSYLNENEVVSHRYRAETFLDRFAAPNKK